MYFSHAFRKDFLPASTTLASSGTTADLSAGAIGFFNAKTFAALTSAGATPFILAQGSYFTSDKIGPFHGGYKESVKSKVINPKYVSRVIKVAAKTPLNQIKTLEFCNLECGKTYRLRLDLKGSPALRFLSHNIYRTLDAFTGCCADESNPGLVDPTIAAIAFAKQVNNDPILKNFISVAVKNTADATVAAGSYDTFTPAGSITETSKAKLVITVAYADTKFGTCTFTPTDHYELEPLFIYSSMLDETGDPCHTNCFTETETQAPRQASGSGETVLRALILDGRYRQEAYPDSTHVDHLRMREIEANPGLANVNRSGLYDQVLILHSVPRFNNPTSTFDNDQYLLVLNVPTGTSTTAITDFVVNSAVAAGNAVALETFS